MANLRTYRQYEHDAISDSSTDFPTNNLRAKRPWSDDSNDNDQDTFMSGDDSLSSSCSISEMRSLKRLRIEDNQPQQHPFPSQRLHRSRTPPPAVQSVSISINGGEPSVCGNTRASLSPWSASSRGKTTSHVIRVKEDSTGIRCSNSQTTKESNEYTGFNRVLGNLHMSRRNRPTADPGKRQDGHAHNQNNSLRLNINSRGHGFNTRNNSIMQQSPAQNYNQQEVKNAPKWKRQVNLQSSSSLY